MTRPLRSVVALLAAGSLVLGACASDDESDDPPPTTADEVETPQPDDDEDDESADGPAIDYSGRGPHEVGYIEMDVDGVEVFVFYPADDEGLDDSEHVTSISSTVAFPDEFAELVPDFFIQELPVDYYPDAPASDAGPFPVVLHSHGASGFPLYSANHLSHTASWGYVVAAPSHPTRNLAAAVGGGASTEASDVDDLAATLDRLEAENGDAESLLFDTMDTSLVGAEGHSAGGRAVLQWSMTDDRVQALIGLAPAPPVRLDLLVPDQADETSDDEGEADPEGQNGAPVDDQDRATLTAEALAELDPPTAPTLLMPGERDGVIPLESIAAIYTWLAAPKAMVVLADAGHNPFLDICAPIREQGGLVANAGDFADAFGPLLALGEDGCVEGYLEPEAGFDLSRHLTVAWYRWAFGEDDSTASLAPSFLEATFPDATGDISEDL
ncbi:MAG: hypothetical protein JJU45_09240 [Acidimicrobiia bacterium]|nr:hypothetical protein [Acidimicrobiia bacterium]